MDSHAHHRHVAPPTFTQTNLVSDGSVPAQQTDPNLINPWGMSSSPTSPIWISDNGTGLASIYGVSDGTVTVNRIPPVTIAPATPGGDPAAPTGQVFNAFQADNAFMLTRRPAGELPVRDRRRHDIWLEPRRRHAVDHHRQRVDRPVGR